MKKNLTLLFSLVLLWANSLSAQIPVDTAANWQQFIPNLLGGNCVQISNVSFSGDLIAFGMFQDSSNILGIPQGILMTSGSANIAPGPNNQSSAGIANGAPGDTLLASIAGGMSYNAAIIEFDFTSPVDDTVNVRYSLGSEEFEEFVGTNFNDIFGFFVSGPGIVGEENIALVPGTTTPVAINNVNQFLNTIYYRPNADTLDLLHNYIQYDGLTVPLTATFFAQAGQTYHLKMAISDIGDGIFDSGVFLEIQSSNESLAGVAQHQGLPATAGIVELFGYNNNPGLAPIIDTAIIDPATGAFDFPVVPAGAYILRLTLDTTVYPGTYPMYFDSVALWDDATIVSLPCNNANLPIQAFNMPLANGPGAAAGMFNVFNPQQQERFPLTPAANIHLFLLNDNDGSVQSFVRTDANGMFRFEGIPYGTYRVIPDVPGLPVSSYHTITLSAQDANLTGLDYVMDETEIYAAAATGTPQANTLEALRIFPQPASGQLFVEVEGTLLGVRLFDLQGRSIAVPTSLNGNTAQLEVGGLSAGLYSLQIIGAQGTQTQVISVR